MHTARIFWGVAALVGLTVTQSACSYWDLRVENMQTTNPTQVAVESGRIAAPFQLSVPYITLYADMTRTPNTSVNPCSDSFVLAALRKRTRSLALSMDIGSDTFIPLFSASRDGNGCMQAYSGMYVVPRLKAENFFNRMPMKIISGQTGEESVSGYIAAGLDLASSMAVPGSGPVITTMTTVLGSTLATNVKAQINRNLSASMAVSDGLMTINPGTDPDHRDRVYVFDVVAYKSDTQYNVDSNAKVVLAKLSLYQQWRRTVVGIESGGNITFDDSASALGTSLVVFNNGRAQLRTISQFLNDKVAGIADAVANSAQDDSASVVRQRCNMLRGQMPEFNTLDQAAILWIVYRDSPHARFNYANNGLSNGACLTWQEIDGLKKMGLNPRTLGG